MLNYVAILLMDYLYTGPWKDKQATVFPARPASKEIVTLPRLPEWLGRARPSWAIAHRCRGGGCDLAGSAAHQVGLRDPGHRREPPGRALRGHQPGAQHPPGHARQRRGWPAWLALARWPALPSACRKESPWAMASRPSSSPGWPSCTHRRADRRRAHGRPQHRRRPDHDHDGPAGGMARVLQGTILFLVLGGDIFVRYRLRVSAQRKPRQRRGGIRHGRHAHKDAGSGMIRLAQRGR
jgi:hypothetical protein